MNYPFVAGDLKCTTGVTLKVAGISLIVGLMNALAGAGPGPMFVAMLLRLDVHPQVATETANAMGIFLAYGSTICMIIYG